MKIFMFGCAKRTTFTVGAVLLLVCCHSWETAAVTSKCFKGAGNVNCRRLSNKDLECVLPRNESSCQETGRNNDYGWYYDCALTVIVYFGKDGKVDRVQYEAGSSNASSFFDSKFSSKIENSFSLKRSFTGNCDGRCCNKKIVIPSVYLFVRRPAPPVRCYSCVGQYTPPHTCNITNGSSCSVPENCTLVEKRHAQAVCEMTVVVSDDSIFYYAQVSLSSNSSSNPCKLAQSLQTITDNGNYTCTCKSDLCNNEITFRSP